LKVLRISFRLDRCEATESAKRVIYKNDLGFAMDIGSGRCWECAAGESGSVSEHLQKSGRLE
jgi:hypothetical protein